MHGYIPTLVWIRQCKHKHKDQYNKSLNGKDALTIICALIYVKYIHAFRWTHDMSSQVMTKDAHPYNDQT